MPNRFDIFISRLETKNARDGVPPHPMNDQNSVRRDKADAKPVRTGQAHAEKGRAKRHFKHDA